METYSGLVKEDICIEISKDKMLGVISFSKPQEDAVQIGLEELREALNKKGIVKGIDEEELKQICKSHTCGYKYVIAKGKAPEAGRDGYVEFAFDVQALRRLRPKEREDGTVDLRDLGAVKNVKEGQRLASKVSPTEGVAGYNILGEVLRAKRGKEVRMPKGRNTKILEDGLTLVSEIDGKLEYDGYNIYINSLYTVRGNVDSSIGNIDFIGSVVVHGSVYSGFEIKAGGSVEVYGSVEDAEITAGEDIILSYGIQGTQKSKIVAKGNIVTKFIQNATVEAGKTIVTETIVHSKVTASDGIIVEKGKGSIVGGEISATNLIAAKSIGSPMGTLTIIRIGALPRIYTEFKELGQKMREKRGSLDKVDQSLKFLLNKKQNGTLSVQQLSILEKLMETRGPLTEAYEDIRDRYQKVGEQLNDVELGTVKAKESVYPGIKIIFGSLVKYIDEQKADVVIRKKDGDIKVNSQN